MAAVARVRRACAGFLHPRKPQRTVVAGCNIFPPYRSICSSMTCLRVSQQAPRQVPAGTPGGGGSSSSQAWVNQLAPLCPRDQGKFILVHGMPVPDVAVAERAAQKLHDRLGVEAMAVVCASMPMGDGFDMAVQLFDRWGVGEAVWNDGVLIVVCRSTRAVHMVMGNGLTALTSHQLDMIRERSGALDMFRAAKFGEGVAAMLTATMDKLVDAASGSNAALALVVHGGPKLVLPARKDTVLATVRQREHQPGSRYYTSGGSKHRRGGGRADHQSGPSKGFGPAETLLLFIFLAVLLNELVQHVEHREAEDVPDQEYLDARPTDVLIEEELQALLATAAASGSRTVLDDVELATTDAAAARMLVALPDVSESRTMSAPPAEWTAATSPKSVRAVVAALLSAMQARPIMAQYTVPALVKTVRAACDRAQQDLAEALQLSASEVPAQLNLTELAGAAAAGTTLGSSDALAEEDWAEPRDARSDILQAVVAPIASLQAKRGQKWPHDVAVRTVMAGRWPAPSFEGIRVLPDVEVQLAASAVPMAYDASAELQAWAGNMQHGLQAWFLRAVLRRAAEAGIPACVAYVVLCRGYALTAIARAGAAHARAMKAAEEKRKQQREHAHTTLVTNSQDTGSWAREGAPSSSRQSWGSSGGDGRSGGGFSSGHGSSGGW